MHDQTTKPSASKFLTNAKRHKKGLLTAGILLTATVALLLSGRLGKSKEAPLLDLADTTILAYTDLRSTISATGTVASADSNTVYSTMAYPVMAVHVEVGDYVRKGDLLAELDGQSIQNQITSQELSLDLSNQSSQQQVKAAQDSYHNFKSGLDQGLNTTLNSAKNQVETAYNNYLKAENTYTRYLDSLDEGENTTVLNAENALRTARTALHTAQDAYDAATEGYFTAQDAVRETELQHTEASEALDALKADLADIGQAIDSAAAELAELSGLNEADRTEAQTARMAELEAQLSQLQTEKSNLDLQRLELEVTAFVTKSAYDQAREAFTQVETALDSAASALGKAEDAYDLQRATYNATMTNVDNTLADYLTNVNTAWDTYQDALTAQAAAEKSTREQLQSYENSLTSAQIGANKATAEESLRQLKETLADTRITAPCDGTVTAVYAKVGSTGSGLLFVIEDIENLIVDTSVKGYDVGLVQPGTAVLIRSDATGSAELSGVLSTIAPTASKNAQGMTDMTGDATFAAEVRVTEQNSGLRIGMEAQLDYILAEEDHVLAVPYDAVYTDDQGRTCILAALEQEDGRYLIQSYPVTTGMDDDLDMAVSGPGIAEGLRVINEADAYLELLGQTVLAGTGLHADLMSAMMGG